jgi:hypothetical protein
MSDEILNFGLTKHPITITLSFFITLHSMSSLLSLSYRALVAASLLCAATLPTIQAQSVAAPSWQWAKPMPHALPLTFPYGGTTYNRASITDSNTNNNYIAGYFSGAADFGDKVLVSSSNDGYILKHDTQGTVLWARQILGSGSPDDIALDATGNVYIVGSMSRKITFSPEISLERIGDGTNLYIAKYSAAGTLLWAHNFGGPNISTDGLRGTAVVVSSTGLVYVAAALKGRASFGTVQVENLTGAGPVLLQLSLEGAVQWARAAVAEIPASVTTFSTSYDLGVDATGAPYLGGTFLGNLRFGPYQVTTPPDRRAVFLTHYTAQGDPQWASQSAVSSNGSVGLSSLATDAAGNSYITGTFGSSVNFGAYTITSKGASDVFLMKYDAAGTVQWTNSFGSKNSDYSSKVVVVPSGGVVIAGGVGEGTTTVSPGLELTGMSDNTYAYVVQFTTQGTAQWVQQPHGAPCLVNGLSADNAGNFYISGIAAGNLLFGSLPAPTPGFAGTAFAARLSNTVLSINARRAAHSLSIYPSLTSGTADVHLGALPKGTTLYLSDALGRIMCQQIVGLEPAHLLLPNLRAGLYALKATAPNGEYYTGRLIVE